MPGRLKFCIFGLGTLKKEFRSYSFCGIFQSFLTVEGALLEAIWIFISSFRDAFHSCKKSLTWKKNCDILWKIRGRALWRNSFFIIIGDSDHQRLMFKCSGWKRSFQGFSVVLLWETFQFFTYELNWRYKLCQLVGILFCQLPFVQAVFLERNRSTFRDEFLQIDWKLLQKKGFKFCWAQNFVTVPSARNFLREVKLGVCISEPKRRF